VEFSSSLGEAIDLQLVEKLIGYPLCSYDRILENNIDNEGINFKAPTAVLQLKQKLGVITV
jgi:hypothetical protein